MLRWSPGERERNQSSRSPFGPLSVFSWIRYAKPQVLRKRAKLPAAQKLAVIKPPQPEKPGRRSIMSALFKRFFSFEFWLGVAAGVAVRTAAKFAIHSAVVSAYGPKAETAANFAACAIAGMVAGFVVHLVRTSYRNSYVLDGEKEKYFGKAAFKSMLTGLFGGTLGGVIAEFSTLFISSNMLAAGAGTGALATIPASIAKSVHAALESGHEAIKNVVKEVSHSKLNITLPKSLLQSNNWPGVMHADNGFTPSHSMLTQPHTVHGPTHAHHHATQKHFASRSPAHHAHGHGHFSNHGYASRKEYLHHMRVVNGRYYTRMAALNQERIIQSHLHGQAMGQSHTQLDIKGPCADPGTACQEHVYFDGNGDATKVVLEEAQRPSVAGHFDVPQADAQTSPDASKVSYLLPFNRGVAPALS